MPSISAGALKNKSTPVDNRAGLKQPRSNALAGLADVTNCQRVVSSFIMNDFKQQTGLSNQRAGDGMVTPPSQGIPTLSSLIIVTWETP
jgi:hypothetical protein